ncbi:MAG: PAS domain-containing sensor histidine kinase [Ignavibacteriaceae bacterium]
MLKIINYTLEIICRSSSSCCGCLLSERNSSYEIISSFNDAPYSTKESSKSILKSLKKEKLSFSELESSKTFKNILMNEKFNSSFSRQLILPNESIFYLILFSPKENFYTKAKIKIIEHTADLLKSQLEFLYEKNYSEGINETGKFLLNGYQNKFETVKEIASEFIFLLDIEGYFAEVNSYGASSLDYEPSELTGRHFTDLVSAKEQGKTAKSIQQLLKKKEIVTFETIFISKFGNNVRYEIKCKPLSHDNEINGVIGIGRNISELRSYEDKLNDIDARLKEAQRIILIERQRSKRQKSFLDELNNMKSDFVSNISHELRTPLASIIGFSETITSDLSMPDDMKTEFINIILNEGKRLAKLVNDLLNISRFEEGNIFIAKSEFNIIPVLKDAINLNRNAINKKNITLTIEILDENIILNADKGKILLVLDSIIKNAIKQTNTEGRIIIIAQSLYKEFEITISDTGTGISESALQSIFKKFQRVKFLDQTPEETGLNLVFIKQIVDLHKGFIAIQSELNNGTSVIIKLPRDLTSSIN